MTTYLVDVTYYLHTCPADPHPHVIDIHRRIVDIIPGGPCLTPVTIRLGHSTATVDCGQHEPSDRQCQACLNTVTIRTATTIDLGPASTHVVSVPTGYAPDPCQVCQQPLAAALAHTGHHLFCHPHRRTDKRTAA